MKIYKGMPYVILISFLLAVIIIYAGLIQMFFGSDVTIIAGVIAFIGALLGGYITYFGVNRTLNHRDREVFFESATEKLMIMEGFIDTYKVYLNSVFFQKHISLDDERDRNFILSQVESIHNQLMEDRKEIYKVLELDAIEIINFHKKSLMSYSYKKRLTKEEAEKCIEKIRDVYQIFNVSKEQLEYKYRRYKNKK